MKSIPGKIDMLNQYASHYAVEEAYYTIEEIQNHTSVKDMFKNIQKRFVKFDTNKKKMQKIIAKEYINFIRNYENDKILIRCTKICILKI